MTETRRLAREWAVQMLTAADLNPPDDIDGFVALQWEQMASLDSEDGGSVSSKRSRHKDFAEERVKGVLRNLQKIDAELSTLLDNWDLYRLGTVERAVLRMGVWELMCTDVPVPVVINEAIDIVNWFSNPKSRTLMNGVLDKYAKKVRA